MIQWHPIFARLLKPVLGQYYEIQTDVPVGDLPRQADILVLRRATARTPPFHGIWRNLSPWNILEFKGRSESARFADVDGLVEVGLGIHRRLHEKDSAGSKLSREDVSFWYLANHLGKRFLRDVTALVGDLELVGPGLWRTQVLRHPFWLVSNRDLPIDAESLPVHLVSEESDTRTLAVAELVVTQADWWDIYGLWLNSLYPNLWKEIMNMATKRGRKEIDWSLACEEIGIKGLVKHWGVKQVIAEIGPKKVVEEIGPKQVIEEIGPKQVIQEFGVEEFLAQLDPQQRRELKRRLQNHEA